MILLARHAEKHLTGDGTLTNQGLMDALAYGQQLKDHHVAFDVVISSPVTRCVQTAEQIIQGLNHPGKVQLSPLLGDPGIFIADDQKAGQAFEDFSVCEVINKMLAGEKLAGFVPLALACNALVDDMKAQMSSHKSVLYVSHDAVIMPFMAYLRGIKHFKEADMIDYLASYRIQLNTEAAAPALTIQCI